MDAYDDDDVYIKSNSSALNMTNVSSSMHLLYTTARIPPLSLAYYGLCLHNGSYIVKLHFAEIIFTNYVNTYTSLGHRILDVYIQEKLVLKDFNIVEEAGGAATPIVKTFTVNVWDMYDKDDLEVLVDEGLGDKFNVEEAFRYIKIGLLCTQDELKQRPKMSAVLKMLEGEIDVNIYERLSRPKTICNLMQVEANQRRKRRTSTKNSTSTSTSTSTSSTQLYNTDTSMSHGTITFMSIYDRTE